MRFVTFAVMLMSLAVATAAVERLTLSLPPRPADAPCGADIAREIRDLDLAAREDRIFREVAAGNVPDFLRTLWPVSFTHAAGDTTRVLRFRATPDYLAVGHDTNFLRIPLTPMTAQRLADLMDCSLPTPTLTDAIWRCADVALEPQPMPAGPAMTSVRAFEAHDELIQRQARQRRGLIAGHKKDVVLAPRLTNRVAIYGWHRPNGQPIQPFYAKHAATWVDYSHGIRLIANDALLDGRPVRLPDVLTNAPRYATNWPASPGTGVTNSPAVKAALPSGERETELNLAPEVRVRLNVPAPSSKATNELLVLFALPNGSTIEQTAGRRPISTNDWRHDLQHIAAQTRFVRAALPQTRIGVAYLEAEGLSWPAWRKRHGDDRIPDLVDAVRAAFSGNECDFALSAHSGGGRFIFGYLNAVTNAPPQLRRIAFLDANYAYDTAAHHEKLARWLDQNETRLVVLAYHDSTALLNGKSFVSAEGGTWGRSAAMVEDFARDFPFLHQTNGPMRTHQAALGRVEFRLRENPERKIWHTLLVGQNGFIHVLLTGTPASGVGYELLGPRAYEAYLTH